MSDAPGVLPPKAASTVYVAITGTPDGGRNELSLKNEFSVLVSRVIKSNNLAKIKLFAATFLAGAANALTEKEQTIFGSVDSRSLNNAPFKGAELGRIQR